MDGILHHLREFAQVLGPRHIWGLEVATSWAGHLWAGGGCCLVPPPPPAPPPVCSGVDAGAALGGHWHSVIKTSVSLMKSYLLPGRGETQIIMNQFALTSHLPGPHGEPALRREGPALSRPSPALGTEGRPCPLGGHAGPRAACWRGPHPTARLGWAPAVSPRGARGSRPGQGARRWTVNR